MSAERDQLSLSAASFAGIELFRELDAETRAVVASYCHGHRYPPEAQIVSHQDPTTDVYFIVSGTVRITFFSSTGKEISFRDMHAGESFGELSAIDGQGRSAYVVSLTESVLATMPRDRFLGLLREHPGVAMATLRHLTGLVRALSERVVEFSTLGVKNRIHAELLRLALEHGRDDGSAVIDPAPKHADIASRVSTHREAVTRELGELSRAGIVERAHHALRIPDVAALERLVREVAQR